MTNHESATAHVYYTDSGPDTATEIAAGNMRTTYNDAGDILLWVEDHNTDALTEQREAYALRMSYDAAARLMELLHRTLKDSVEHR